MDPESADRSPRLTPRLVFGLAVMALGLMLTLDNLGVLEARRFLRLWPVVLIAMGLVKLLSPGYARERGGAFIWLLLGVAFLLSSLGLLDLHKLWPLVLLVVGGSMVARALSGEGGFRLRRSTPATSSDAVVRSFAFMGGITRGTNAQDFRGGEAGAVMGGCEIDLRQARMQGGEAVIDTFAVWGGIEIYVPEDWEVVNKGFALMGGFTDETKRPAEPKGRLVVTGFAVMGGVEISN
jgi:hypothetical protein